MRMTREFLAELWLTATDLGGVDPLAEAIITEAMEGGGGDGETCDPDEACRALSTLFDDISAFQELISKAMKEGESP